MEKLSGYTYYDFVNDKGERINGYKLALLNNYSENWTGLKPEVVSISAEALRRAVEKGGCKLDELVNQEVMVTYTNVNGKAKIIEITRV